MNKSGRILVIGSINLDLVVHSPHLPYPGETILGSDFQTHPGGKGANQAVAAARLGAQVRMIGKVGQDDFGQAMLSSLSAAGIDVDRICVDEHQHTGVALITVDDAAENTIVVASGANLQITPEEIDDSLLFQRGDLLLVQLEIPVPTVYRAIERAHEAGMRVILNPAPARKVDRRILAMVDFLIPNENEILLLSGEKQPEDAIRRIREWTHAALLITQGKKGVLVVDDHGQTSVPSFPVKAIDTTGAGDTFIGAFAVGILNGSDVLSAARRACAAAAIAVTRPGAQSSMPTQDELDLFLQENDG